MGPYNDKAAFLGKVQAVDLPDSHIQQFADDRFVVDHMTQHIDFAFVFGGFPGHFHRAFDAETETGCLGKDDLIWHILKAPRFFP
ncbi:hypothetical protein SDC9_134698 [bioreactor metagenome]|uniref:Uncharacterized protein n=1 Tax=bioreactor metagenome TaxID=1076179 RepID=A0A645DEY5_9ZZZZ